MADGSLVVQVGTVITLVGGTFTTLFTTRRNRDKDEYKDARRENKMLRADNLALLAWGNAVEASLAAQGITIPPMPHLQSQDFQEDDDDPPTTHASIYGHRRPR